MVVERVTREQLFEQVFRGDLPCGANGEMRITRVRVPGREVDLAHVMGVSGRRVCEMPGLDIGVHEGEDHTGEALGLMRFTPWEAVVVAADMAVKCGSIEIGFMDRFNGSLILTGGIAEVESAEQEVLDYFGNVLGFHVCQMTRR